MPRDPDHPYVWDPGEIPEAPDGYDQTDLYWSELGYLTAKYMWNTHGDNCVVCNALRGRVYTLDFWYNCGIFPGWHQHCDCTLKRVSDDVALSDPDFFGTNIPEYAKMWLPTANIFWDPEFMIQPWQMSIVDEIEKMHLLYGADTPFSEIMQAYNKSGFLSKKPSFTGDTAGWVIYRTQQHYQNIDGEWSGAKYFTLTGLKYIFEPFWLYFEAHWRTMNEGYDPNKKYAQLKRQDSPILSLRPEGLRPFYPFQSHYTEAEY